MSVLDEQIKALFTQSMHARSWLIIGAGTFSWLFVGLGFFLIGCYSLWNNSGSTNGLGLDSANAKFFIVFGLIASLIYFLLLIVYAKEQSVKKKFFMALANNTLQPQKIILVYRPPRPMDTGIEVGPYPAFYAIAITDQQFNKDELLFPLPREKTQELFEKLKERYPQAEAISML